MALGGECRRLVLNGIDQAGVNGWIVYSSECEFPAVSVVYYDTMIY